MQNLFGAVLILLIMGAIALMIPGCTTPVVGPEQQAAAAPEHPPFPPDMKLICHEGWFVIISPSTESYVRLPIRCQQA